MNGLGGQSEVTRLKKVLLKHPREAFIDEKHIRRQWEALNYVSRPDFGEAIHQYDKFVELLRRMEVEILFLPRDDRTGLDSIYTHDTAVVTDEGVILCSMGKTQRRGEPSAVQAFLKDHNLPILGWIQGEGRLEGGDVVWIDERTLVVGQGYRTNREGIRQLRQLLGDRVDDLVAVPLPHWKGPEDVFHLMSVFSPISHDLAMVYSPLLPVFFRQWLQARRIRLLEVPESEFSSLGCNVLALAPGKCIMVSGNAFTRKILEKEGVDVWAYDGSEISLKGLGGPTCLTRPLLRVG